MVDFSHYCGWNKQIDRFLLSIIKKTFFDMYSPGEGCVQLIYSISLGLLLKLDAGSCVNDEG